MEYRDERVEGEGAYARLLRMTCKRYLDTGLVEEGSLISLALYMVDSVKRTGEAEDEKVGMVSGIIADLNTGELVTLLRLLPEARVELDLQLAIHCFLPLCAKKVKE